MAGPEGYEDGRQIGARPYLERVGGDMVGPITFQVSGATTPHIAGGTGFGPLVFGKAATATYATADTDVVIGDDFEVKGMTWALGNIRADSLQSVAANTPISVSNQQGSGFSANYNSTTMYGRSTTDASTQVFRLTAGRSATAGREAGPIGIYAGYNSTDVGRYAPVVIGAQPYVTTATYAAGLTNQSHPLLAIFSADDPTTEKGRRATFGFNGINNALWRMTTDVAPPDFVIRSASALTGASVNKDGADIVFRPGRSAAGGTAGRVRIWQDGHPTSGYVEVGFLGSNGFLVTGESGIEISARDSVPAPTINSTVMLYLDETANKLHFKVRYAAGAIKTGEVALT